MPDRSSFLGIYSVLDLSGRLGWLAGRILGDLGANIIKVEPPGFDDSDPWWRATNINKKQLRLDIHADAGRELVETLLGRVDVLIRSSDTAVPAPLWLAPERVSRQYPDLVQVNLSPFGAKGPRASWRGSDIEMMAAGGAVSLIGDPDRAPLRISVPQSHAWAGAQAAIGAVLALLHRGTGGGGQVVDVSAQAAIVGALAHAPTFVDIAGTVPGRAGSLITGRSVRGAVFRAFWKCRDGYINFVLYGGPAGRRTNRNLVSWMREKGADLGGLADQDWDDFSTTDLSQDEVDRLEAPIAAFFATIGMNEFLDEALARAMLGYPVWTVADISRDPQLEARGFWQDWDLPGGGRERHCGAFYLLDGQRPVPDGRAARVTPCEILSGLGFSDSQLTALSRQGVLQEP